MPSCKTPWFSRQTHVCRSLLRLCGSRRFPDPRQVYPVGTRCAEEGSIRLLFEIRSPRQLDREVK